MVGDTYGSEAKGWYCSASSDVTTGTNSNPWVLTQTDIDDNCQCTANTNKACFDCQDNCLTAADYLGEPTGVCCDSECTAAGYLIGCDGANSVTRKQIVTKMDNLGFAQKWAVVDLILKKIKKIYQIEQSNIQIQGNQLLIAEMLEKEEDGNSH